ncbi:MAG TPA: dTMP kinase [Firmicutes bacterium]|nr:dTMP kinase [Bacillota bacterium]
MGAFITFEGVDGAGKSTQLELLVRALRRAGYPVIASREPGGSPLGEAVRQLLLDPKYTFGSMTEVLLMAAARAAHVEQVIRPALDRGDFVLVDRYVDSSLAYQGVGLGVGIDPVLRINEFAIQRTWPDLTILLDVPVAVAWERIRTRRGEAASDRLEARGSGYQEKVRTGYLELARRWPERIVVVDARGPVQQVAEQVRVTVHRRLGLAI